MSVGELGDRVSSPFRRELESLERRSLVARPKSASVRRRGHSHAAGSVPLLPSRLGVTEGALEKEERGVRRRGGVGRGKGGGDVVGEEGGGSVEEHNVAMGELIEVVRDGMPRESELLERLWGSMVRYSKELEEKEKEARRQLGEVERVAKEQRRRLVGLRAEREGAKASNSLNAEKVRDLVGYVEALRQEVCDREAEVEVLRAALGKIRMEKPGHVDRVVRRGGGGVVIRRKAVGMRRGGSGDAVEPPKDWAGNRLIAQVEQMHDHSLQASIRPSPVLASSTSSPHPTHTPTITPSAVAASIQALAEIALGEIG